MNFHVQKSGRGGVTARIGDNWLWLFLFLLNLIFFIRLTFKVTLYMYMILWLQKHDYTYGKKKTKLYNLETYIYMGVQSCAFVY